MNPNFRYPHWPHLLRVLAMAWLFASASAQAENLKLARDGQWLVISGSTLPGGEIRINYLEAYCRAGSTDADWGKHTVCKTHVRASLTSADGRTVKLRDTLADGVTVEHTVTAGADEVDFRLIAHNPTANRSEAHWAQPCIRLSKFLGADEKTAGGATDYLPKSFVFLGGKLVRMPTP